MKITLVTGAEYDVAQENIKRIVYQRVRGNTRYYVAIGDDLQALEQEVTKGCYTQLVKEITGVGKTKNGSDELLSNGKTSRRSTRKD